MKINTKKILIIYLACIMSFQLVGCKTNLNKEEEMTIEEQKQLLLEQEREKALQQLEEKERLEKITRKKIQSQIAQMEDDISTIIEYMWSYDLTSEISKLEKDKKYITFKENTLTYQKINDFKKSTNNFDKILKEYSDIYIEYLEKLHSVTIDILRKSYTNSSKNLSSTNKAFYQYSSEVQLTKIEYESKLIEYYNENLSEYEKENNVVIQYPSVLILNAFYKSYITLESIIPNS